MFSMVSFVPVKDVTAPGQPTILAKWQEWHLRFVHESTNCLIWIDAEKFHFLLIERMVRGEYICHRLMLTPDLIRFLQSAVLPLIEQLNDATGIHSKQRNAALFSCAILSLNGTSIAEAELPDENPFHDRALSDRLGELIELGGAKRLLAHSARRRIVSEA